MFTGIVETVGAVVARHPAGGGSGLVIEASALGGRLSPGDSVAVNGVCLTATTAAAARFGADLSEATVSRTTLGGLRPGDRVNLELAVRAGTPLGGHLVQGHVDGTGEVVMIEQRGETRLLQVRIDGEIVRVTVPRGSLAIDGVSLTVSGLAGDVAEFAIIPYTWSHTNFSDLEAGARVNVEADVIGKYVRGLLEPYADALGSGAGS